MTHVLLRLGDLLFGWLLRLPSDLTLIVVALGSSLILAGVRVWTTDQDRLRRCKSDLAILKTRMKTAKREKNREALANLRAIHGRVAMIKFGQEGKPLLAALIPLVLLATWAFFRLEVHPPEAGEPLTVAAYFPASAAGRLTHLVPAGETEADSWIRSVRLVTDQGPEYGLAEWTFRPPAGDQTLVFRYAGNTFTHPLRVGGDIPGPGLKPQAGGVTLTEVRMEKVKLFGVVPGVPQIGFAPWLVAYLIIVIPFVPVFKRAMRIE